MRREERSSEGELTLGGSLEIPHYPTVINRDEGSDLGHALPRVTPPFELSGACE